MKIHESHLYSAPIHHFFLSIKMDRLLTSESLHMYMKRREKDEIRQEIREISDADHPPKSCLACGNKKYHRKSYYKRDLFELGDPATSRIVRYEAVTWECNKCKASFSVPDTRIPPRTKYMESVIEYARWRILKKGDSANRISEDLMNVHNVDACPATVASWVKENRKDEDLPQEFNEKLKKNEFSGVISTDGTFKAVNPKKNEEKANKDERLFLQVTRLEDGRLGAYWRVVNRSTKHENSSSD